MTEEDARSWLAKHWPAEAFAKLERFIAMVVAENDRQNLIAPSTISSIWNRHALDSAQLIGFAADGATRWLDVGSGGGFPGMVVALAFAGQVTMAEPRRRRAEFLRSAVVELGSDAEVVQGPVEALTGTYDVISARAVASVERLKDIAGHCATASTRWLLPRGKIATTTIEMLRRRRAVFHVEQSLSDSGSSILVVDGRL